MRRTKIIVDEAHCIALWGPKFRPCWGRIGEVHSLVSHRVPIGLATATAPPAILTTIKQSLKISEANHLFLNLGNFRSNLVWEVKTMEARKSTTERLAFLIPEAPSAENFFPNECVLIYVNSRPLGCKILDAIRSLLPPELHDLVDVFHALKGPITKAWLLDAFFEKGIRILICTEAVGMVCSPTPFNRICTN